MTNEIQLLNQVIFDVDIRNCNYEITPRRNFRVGDGCLDPHFLEWGTLQITSTPQAWSPTFQPKGSYSHFRFFQVCDITGVRQ